MIHLLLRADDLGYSEAVNLGIAKTVKEGLIRSVGLMPNMTAAEHGLSLLRGLDICLGQHTNICVGVPVSDPSKIPSLVDENGMFKSSRVYRSAKEDFVDAKEVVLEIEAQYNRFQELTGREPDYFEGHAVRSAAFMRGLKEVALRHGLKYSSMVMPGEEMQIGGRAVNRCPMDSMDPAYDAVQSLQKAVLEAREDMPNLYVCHPGYLDAYLLRSSSLTVNRTKEVEMLCDPTVKSWLDRHNVQCISYNEV